MPWLSFAALARAPSATVRYRSRACLPRDTLCANGAAGCTTKKTVNMEICARHARGARGGRREGPSGVGALRSAATRVSPLAARERPQPQGCRLEASLEEAGMQPFGRRLTVGGGWKSRASCNFRTSHVFSFFDTVLFFRGLKSATVGLRQTSQGTGYCTTHVVRKIRKHVSSSVNGVFLGLVALWLKLIRQRRGRLAPTCHQAVWGTVLCASCPMAQGQGTVKHMHRQVHVGLSEPGRGMRNPFVLEALVGYRP